MQDTNPKKPYTLLKKEEKEGSKIALSAEIPREELVPFRKKVLDALRHTVDIDGFRQGKAPDEVVEKHVGTMAVMEKMAGEALAEIYPRILADENIDAVGHPQISVTRMAPGNALTFTAETAVMPVITLGDYKKAAKNAIAGLSTPNLDITEEDIEKSLLNLRKRLAHAKWHQEHPEEKDHNHPDIKDEDLPALTDEDAKALGPYDSADAVREETKRALAEDKKNRERSRRRAAIADAVVASTPFTIPELFIDGELGMMLGEFKQTIAHMGMSLDDYLKNIKKTEDDLKKEWRNDAEKRARLQLLLNRIAAAEKLAPEQEKIQHEVAHLLEHHKGAKEENVRSYVESVMRNDLVFDFLEKGSETK